MRKLKNICFSYSVLHVLCANVDEMTLIEEAALNEQLTMHVVPVNATHTWLFIALDGSGK